MAERSFSQRHADTFPPCAPHQTISGYSDLIRGASLQRCVSKDGRKSYPSRDGFPPELSQNLSAPIRAWGMPGACRTRSLVCESKKAHELVTTSPPTHPAFPHANGFNGLWRALPGESGFLATVTGRDAQASSAGLMPASRHQDHTLSPSADLRRSSLGMASVHRTPAQRFVTTAKRPLLPGRDARIPKGDLPDGLSEIFFAGGLDGGCEAPGVVCPARQIGRAALRLISFFR